MENLHWSPTFKYLKYLTLDKFSTDLTKLAAEGKLDPVIGREDEIKRLMQILCKRRKNSACLIGDRGVGKTAIAAGLVHCIVNAAVPKKLQGKKVLSLDGKRFSSESKTYQQLQETLRNVIHEVKKSRGAIVLFIDDLTTFTGTCSSQKSSNVVKPILALEELKCIGATTVEEYKKYIETDPALKGLFQVVQVPEPSVDLTIDILKGIQRKYKMHHHVKYEDEALNACAKLSKKYISAGYLPDKAINLMDEAGSQVALYKKSNDKKNGKDVAALVTVEDVKQVISSQTGIPIEKVSEEESARLLDMANVLRKHILGQDEAIQAVSRALRRARVGLSDPDRPVASFLFTGPTGVGKTQVAKLVAQEYFGSRESMVRLDMSEYMERHSVNRLFGSPPGYINNENGGFLTEAILRKPHNVILFDEIEKAHQDVFNALLQILDDGRLTDGKGQVVNFKHTIIIMTSNIGFSSSSLYECEISEEDVTKQLKGIFRPEFLNRLDEIIIFKKLGNGDLMKILDLLLEEVQERIRTKSISLEFTKKFKEKLLLESCGEGNSNTYEARSLRRAITRFLEDKLAEGLLNGNIKGGDSLIIDVNAKKEVLLSVDIQKQQKRKRLRSFEDQMILEYTTEF